MSISKSYSFDHSVEVVYAAWIASETVIAPATAMDIDARVGGHYRLIMETGSSALTAQGVFSIVEPAQRLVYSWQWSGSDEVTTIDVRFLREAQGSRVHLEHTGFLTEESRSNHDAGWDSYASGLARHLDSA